MPKINSKIENYITDTILSTLYEARKAFTSHSLLQYLLYDYYQAKRYEYNKRQSLIKERKRIRDAIYYLTKANYIKIDKNNNLSLLSKGIFKIINQKFKKYQPNKDKSSGFYLVIFDIPEKVRRIRYLFRKVLYHASATKLQKSVFVIREKKAFCFIKDLVRLCKLSNYIKFIKCKGIEKV